ncbi:MAG: elongation factor P maturation arginine rhamnosyltransferase EarP [Burkholderiales bacterium]
MTRTWDIFCSVVDNYGDIGICWRLARQLSSELGYAVRLWVDDLAAFHHLCVCVDPALDTQRIDAVEVRYWSAPMPPVHPADIVIEGFGVRLPESYVADMAARSPRPVWINLEHVSAEPWVDGSHGLPSPHPRLPLTKYFFFPGFTAKTGGLLIEHGLAQTRAAFQSDTAAVASFRHSLGIARADTTPLCVSLFCYDNAALPALVDTWATAPAPVVCVAPAGRVLEQLSAITARNIDPATSVQLGSLTIVAPPFLDLDKYDRLLWACDLNFVRGEDSFVRAQWAARPLVWQAYVQEQDAHLIKLTAFMDHYLCGLAGYTASSIRALHDAWNRQSAGIGERWRAFAACRVEAEGHARAWAERLAAGRSLAIELAEFCLNRLE